LAVARGEEGAVTLALICACSERRGLLRACDEACALRKPGRSFARPHGARPSCRLIRRRVAHPIVAMKSHPRLRIEPRPSRIACAAILFTCAATAAHIATLHLPAVPTLGCDARGTVVREPRRRRCRGPGHPAVLHAG